MYLLPRLSMLVFIVRRGTGEWWWRWHTKALARILHGMVSKYFVYVSMTAVQHVYCSINSSTSDMTVSAPLQISLPTT